MTMRRFNTLAVVCAMALVTSTGIDAETNPLFAVVEGVVVTEQTIVAPDVRVDGVPHTFLPFEQVAFGVHLAAAPGTVILLHQTWETSQGWCIYWRVLNGVPWRVVPLKRSPDDCPANNRGMSLWTALERRGMITDISGLVTPPPPNTNDLEGIGRGDSRGLGNSFLAGLSRELDSIYEGRGMSRPRPAPVPPSGLRLNDTSSTETWLPIPGEGMAQVANAAVAYRDRLFVFALGSNDRQHYMNVSDGASWSGWQPVPGGGTWVPSDAAVVYHDRLYLFGVGAADGGHYVNIFDGAVWSGWRPIPGVATDVASAAVVHDDHLYVFSAGIADRAHYFNIFDERVWAGWQQVPGGGRTTLAASAASYRGRLYLVAASLDDGVHRLNVLDRSRWTGWQGVFGGIIANHPPLLVANADGLRVFAIGPNDRRRYVNVFAAARWTGWSVADGSVANYRDAAVWFRGRPYLVGIGAADGRRYYRVFP